MLIRIEHHYTRPNAVQQVSKGAGGVRFQFRGLVGSEYPGAALEQFGVGPGGAAFFLAGQRVSAQKLAAVNLLARQVRNLALGAARVGNQRIGPQKRIDVANGVENAPDGG